MRVKHVITMDGLKAYTLEGEGTFDIEVVALLVLEKSRFWHDCDV